MMSLNSMVKEILRTVRDLMKRLRSGVGLLD